MKNYTKSPIYKFPKILITGIIYLNLKKLKITNCILEMGSKSKDHMPMPTSLHPQIIIQKIVAVIIVQNLEFLLSN